MANNLGKKLWKKIEMPQGYAYLSDAVENMPDEKVLQMAAASLEWHKESARVLRAFLKAHLTQRAADGLVRCPNCGALLIQELFNIHACAERPHR